MKPMFSPDAGQVARAILAGVIVTFIACSGRAPSPTIRTPIPPLFENWKAATATRNATDDEVRGIADQRRSGLPSRDPFTPLALMSCDERHAKGERIIWEDSALMALVDSGDRGSTLLVVPKAQANFPTDLTRDQMEHVSRVAAATCDALVIAAGGQPTTDPPSCTMYINPPSALSVRQMHVHVEAHTGVAVPVDDTFLHRAATNLRGLVAGSGCF
jgi:diadenosine tetraphosphate (Ap4A) HIT family hydrolase